MAPDQTSSIADDMRIAMTLQVVLDSDCYPDAFVWNGPVARSRMAPWLKTKTVPEQLVDLWAPLGGGDLFESETILEPAAKGDHNIDIENARLRSRGVPANFLAFHTGYCVSVVDQTTSEIVWLDAESFVERGRFATLDDWYRLLLRAEYGARYGLEPIDGS